MRETIMGVLERAMPYAAVRADNPLFKFEVQRIRWGKSPRQLIRYSFIIWVVSQVLVCALWMGLVVRSLSSLPASTSSHSMLASASGGSIATLLYISIFTIPIFDFMTLSVGLHAIDQDTLKRHGDLLCLTPLDKEEILTAEYGVALVRAWRVRIVETCVRISFMNLILVHYILWAFDPFGALMAVFFAGHIIIFILEPVWRMRALTAIGMAISSRVRNMVIAPLLAFSLLFIIIVVESILFTLVTAVTVFSGLVFIVGPLVSFLIWRALRAFYSRVQARALRYTMNYDFRPN